MIKVCQYCYAVHELTENDINANCFSCKAPLNIERPMLNYEERVLDLKEIYLPYPVLKNYNYLDLYRLLCMAKKKKNELYKKDPNSEEYFFVRRQCELISNLIFDITGKAPRSIKPFDVLSLIEQHNNYLSKHKNFIENNLTQYMAAKVQ